MIEEILIWAWNDGATYLGRAAMFSLALSAIVLIMEWNRNYEKTEN